MNGAGDMQGRVCALEDGAPSLAGRDGDVSVQAIAGGENQSAKIPRSGRGSDDVCERDKQTEQPWSARQTTPSVAVTWGWQCSYS